MKTITIAKSINYLVLNPHQKPCTISIVLNLIQIKYDKNDAFCVGVKMQPIFCLDLF